MRIALFGFIASTSLMLNLHAAERKTPTATSSTHNTQAINASSFKANIRDNVSLTIDGKSRMQDIIEAYNMLRREKGAPKVFLLLNGGEKINQIVDLSPTTNQTLLTIRYSTNQGTQLRVVGIEDIAGVTSIP